MIIIIGERRIEVSHMAELRQLTIFYREDSPDTVSTLMVIPRDRGEGYVWVLNEDGQEVGSMPSGIYDVTDAT